MRAAPDTGKHMTIVYGLLGLSIIVFIHEAGHFAAARIFGVAVESFSIGMGPVLLHKRIGGTDYRLSLIPFGGYCGMKGEKDFQKAMEEGLDSIAAEKDSFYGIHPLKRLCIAFAGPFFNFVSAIIALSVIAMTGYDYYTTPNKIVLAEELPNAQSEFGIQRFPASRAGLQTGDRIIGVNGKSIAYFSDIVETVSLNAGAELHIDAERNGQTLHFTLIPELDKSSGAGKIGIVSWIDPLIENADEGSAARKALLQTGDRIVELNGQRVRNTVDLYKAAENLTKADIVYERGGNLYTAELVTAGSSENKDVNLLSSIQWKVEKVHSNTFSFFPALVQGSKETLKMLSVTIRGIGLLFKGVDVKQAVSGPIGITVMLGQSAKAGFSAGFREGLVTVLNFSAVISLSLFLMNLLPVPILDGGLILFALVELIRGRGLKPKTLYKIQFIGVAFIAVLFIFGMFADISGIILGRYR
ncbi:site-2 protease family protein [Treponema sp. HNW]|uniref:M50 family metallopeptidase n=1 Tax=Treponema sp. HNW TaxID=3116654 RepID=UPI003D0CAA5E